MAEIEETEHGDEGRVREWMGRAMRACRRSGLDRRRRGVGPLAAGVAQWPTRRLSMARAFGRDRHDPSGDRCGAAAAAGAQGRSSNLRPSLRPSRNPSPKPSPRPSRLAATPEPERRRSSEARSSRRRRPSRPRRNRRSKPKPVEAVIPLVHAPDDPGLDTGLDSGLDRDPVPETVTPPGAAAWQRIKQMFR